MGRRDNTPLAKPHLYVYYTCMQKKLTITVDEAVYNGLHAVIGRGNISRFIERIAKPYVVSYDLAEAYKEMAADEEREREADEWCEAMIGDVGDEPW